MIRFEEKVRDLIKQKKITKTALGLVIKPDNTTEENHRVSYIRGQRFFTRSRKNIDRISAKNCEFFRKTSDLFFAGTRCTQYSKND